LRGERTGMRYRLTDSVQVQVARVDLEARRIEFRLVQGTSFAALKREAQRGAPGAGRHLKKAASTKPEQLKGQTAKQRRAAAKRSAKSEAAAPKKAARRSTKKASSRRR